MQEAIEGTGAAMGLRLRVPDVSMPDHNAAKPIRDSVRSEANLIPPCGMAYSIAKLSSSLGRDDAHLAMYVSEQTSGLNDIRQAV